ncbi:TPA: DEAD/DEAH box helicase family protein [Candidatus Scatenecus faecavium]|uniref:DEAD/DEAH box helicase family protein n=1 Tax=Candidatus Scatenecus faecavium TaxID=2840915 RepID=A0A9D1K2W5_9BACT|nr:DEAD/DEAH box helicase family protein [Candidatus Scatenecus faecavium]
MKLKFKHQEFQTDAVIAVADLFAGQEKSTTTFSVDDNSAQMRLLHNDFGIGNKLEIDNDTLLSNMHSIQRRHKLPLSRDYDSRQFSIEMETGTGKTYVYTKTILELNKRYGFSKFIIVVPSVAIREGVFKSLQVTEEHFKNLYDGIPYRYFIYNSAKLSDVRQFATSSNIEIMIINIDAFKKAENIINQEQDKLNGETAMRYIQDTNPVVIIDEPQSVDNTPKAKEAIQSLNPLCVLRYSATHREKINLLYRLTPVDAYQMGLVKQICVSSSSVANDFNKPYIHLRSVSNDNGFSAKTEIDIENKSGKVERKTITVKPNDSLFILSGNRELYEDYVVAGIDCTKGSECIEFSNSEVLQLGKAIGGVDENIIKRTQIYKTIEAHLNKELNYFEKGIKVLSLFFIDEVKKYRTEDGSKGIYAQMFEECYNELMSKEKYAVLKTYFNTDVEKAHNGYFSQDKKGIYKNTKGDTLADDDTYNTIMKDKEWLLSFDCPLRFIFSHSALKEGWDNPNVFQVCTLIEQKSTFTCRQKVGRGLRLCVNQDGERIEDRNINILHVMANESFSEFAEKLQKEIEDETGMKFGVLQLSALIDLTYEEKVEIEHQMDEADAIDLYGALMVEGIIDNDGKVKEHVDIEKLEMPQIAEPLRKEVKKIMKQAEPVTFEKLKEVKCVETRIEEKTFTHEQAEEIIEELKEKKIISKEGKIKDTMKAQLKAGKLDLSERYSKAAQGAIIQALEKADNRPVIRDANKEVTVKLKKQAILSPEFKELWDKIKQKTTYRVNIDTETLIKNCVKELAEMPPIPKAKLLTSTAEIEIENAGIYSTEKHTQTTDLENTYSYVPDILRLIASETLLKHSTIIQILKQSSREQDFMNNPQLFYEKALEIILHNRHSLAIDGIKYVKLAGEEYYVQEIFDSSELLANLDRNAVQVEHSVYDYLIYDSGVESRFAKSLDEDPDVKMFFKIPQRFKIETPIGSYNPDWAVFMEKKGEQKLYFVLETKGTTSLFDLRTPERLKIHCGKQHFAALEDGIQFSEDPVKDWKEFKINL